jgi:hypothetical protein
MRGSEGPRRGTRARRSRRTGLIALGALLLFMAFVVYRSLHIGGVRCEVCITYGDRAQCRTVDAEQRDDALREATHNACAYLSSGVTDSMACARTPPTRVECAGVN